MELINNFLNLNPDYIPLFQVALATFFGMLLGIERVLAGRTAGPRTYGLVSLGSCLITIVSLESLVAYPLLQVGGGALHMVSAIITGVGFIGAGLIIFKDTKLSGLTTAAGIWVAAAIGIAVGFKFYLLAFFSTFLTLFVFTVVWRAERWIKDVFHIEVDHEKQE